MTGWHHIRNRKTGEEQFVASLEGYDVRRWKVTALDEVPTQHHRFDRRTSALVLNLEEKARHERHAEAAKITTADLLDLIDGLRARIVELEKRQ